MDWGGGQKILRRLFFISQLHIKRIQFCPLVYLWFPKSTELSFYLALFIYTYLYVTIFKFFILPPCSGYPWSLQTQKVQRAEFWLIKKKSHAYQFVSGWFLQYGKAISYGESSNVFKGSVRLSQGYRVFQGFLSGPTRPSDRHPADSCPQVGKYQRALAEWNATIFSKRFEWIRC